MSTFSLARHRILGFSVCTIIGATFLGIPAHGATPMRAQEYRITTQDGRAELNVLVNHAKQIHLGRQAKFVLIVGGIPNDVDGLVIVDGKARLLWREILKRLVDAGYHVATYDQRGMIRGSKCEQPQENLRRGVAYTCFDNQIRAQMTLGSALTDIELVYRDLMRRFSISEKQMILLGHSEGGTHIGKLVSSRKVSPGAIVTLATPLQPLADLLDFRAGTQRVELLFSLDKNKDGILTQSEIESGYTSEIAGVLGPYKDVPKSTEGWTKSNSSVLYDFFFGSQNRDRAFLAAKKPDDIVDGSLGGQNFNIGPAGDLLDKYNDKRTLAQYLNGFDGIALFVLFEDDTLVPIRQQMPYVKSTLDAVKQSRMLFVGGIRHDFIGTESDSEAAWRRIIGAMPR